MFTSRPLSFFLRFPSRVGLFFISLYQFLSPMFLAGNSCRFTPSCSEYSKQALLRFGFLKGGMLTIKRLLRCHPLSTGGIDDIPS